MVRMCELMTFACATVLVAGSVASATDKAVRTDVKVDNGTTPAIGSARAYAKTLAVNDAATFAVGSGCSCTWFNGAFDPTTGNGQVSHHGGAVTWGAEAADDFYLCEGFVYELDSISVTLLTTSVSVLTKAYLNIFADCDGCPSGDPLYTFTKGQVSETGIIWGYDYANTPIRVVNVCFRPSLESNKVNQNIILKGGAYWISAYGLTDGQCTPQMNMCDVTFWGTAPAGTIKGRVAKKREGIPCKTDGSPNAPGQFCFGPWRSVEECCVGCTDLAFTVCARECKILIDNGRAAQDPPHGSQSQFAPYTTFDVRTADDFVVPPCRERTLCYIEGCIFTNCDPNFFKGHFEIYGNDCRIPAYNLAGTSNGTGTGGSLLTQGDADKIVDLHFSWTVNGVSYKAYRLEFHHLSYVLAGGSQYWLSIGVKHTFSLLEKAFWCCNDDCDHQCLIHWNPAQILQRPAGMPMPPDWTSAGCDMSFLIAVDDSGPVSGGAATPSCSADFDRSGKVDITDLFSYLDAWFTGCP